MSEKSVVYDQKKKGEKMENEIRLTNVYRVALLRLFGVQGRIENDRGYLQFVFPGTPEVQEIIDRFEEPQPLSLRLYVDQLRRTQEEIRNAKTARGGKYGTINGSTSI